jgi:hypothetical protein
MNVDMERAPAKASIMKQTNSVGDLERAAVKACVIAQLLPFLHPRLLQDGMPLVEAAPLLAKIHINVLQAALATGNVQPVLAKLKAAANQKPASKMGLSWDFPREPHQSHESPIDAKVTFADQDEKASTIALAGLDKSHQSAMSPSSISPSSIASVCDETIVDQMAMTQSSSPTRVASETSLVCLVQPRLLQDGLPWDKAAPLLEKCKSSPQEEEAVFHLTAEGRQAERGKLRNKSDVSVPDTSPSDVSVPDISPFASKHRSEAGVMFFFLFFLLASIGFRSYLPAPSLFYPLYPVSRTPSLLFLLPQTPSDYLPNLYPSSPLSSRGVREGVQAQDNQGGRVCVNGTGACSVLVVKNDTSIVKGTGAVMFRNDTLGTSLTRVPESVMIYYTPIGSRVMIHTVLPESEFWKFGGGAGALY